MRGWMGLHRGASASGVRKSGRHVLNLAGRRVGMVLRSLGNTDTWGLRSAAQGGRTAGSPFVFAGLAYGLLHLFARYPDWDRIPLAPRRADSVCTWRLRRHARGLALAATHDAAVPLDLHPISPPQSSIFNLSLARPA